MMRDELILLIDDEPQMLRNRSRLLQNFGYNYLAINDSYQALNIIENQKPDVVLTDLKMPQVSGMEILKLCKQIDPDMVVILFTAYASVKSAVEAIKLGAFDYLEKPFSAEQFKIVIDRALNYRRLFKGNGKLRTQIKETYNFDNIIAVSPVMKAIFEKIEKIAKSNANILIYGESGTGKELIARSIHARSNRRNESFIPVDCNALPEQLLESELFGHEKGAFTGATAMRRGLFEYAHKGTLFLDEICELSLELQAKLLRVIQERSFRRIGSNELMSIDIRIIAATNRNPEEAVKQQRLREDLYFRLNVIPIHVPPLRERKEDIPLLARYFVDHFAQSSQLTHIEISQEVLECLTEYDWPGNVRELQNLMERLVSLATDKVITLRDLPSEMRKENGLVKKYHEDFKKATFTLPYLEAKEKYLQSFDIQYLTSLLKKYGGNVSKIAQEARLSRKTVYSMLSKYDIRPELFKMKKKLNGGKS
ncbi:sigma-54-dependent Fis family transcriptional regulator [bacterium]|nr:sigma-54-dependent Fis family transcriptional regulator [bacterium]